MAGNISTPDEALAGMAKVGAPRKPMGTDAFKASAAPALKGTLVKKKGAQAADPAQQPLASRNKITVNAGVDRLGAQYTVSTGFAPVVAAEASATQSNGRIVSPSTVRSRNSFDSGISTSY
jgi:hypothetical protein